MILVSIAYALGQGGAPEGGAANFATFIPLILMFVIFYFLLIRPQQKRNKEHRGMIANLKKGDRIVTSGGLHGRITGMDETTLTVEIADKVRVKVNRGNVAGIIQSAPPAPAETKES
ncbi:MAG: preprotein translocase subunit YajC [Hyphomicrobiales bacterium]